MTVKTELQSFVELWSNLASIWNQMSKLPDVFSPRSPTHRLLNHSSLEKKKKYQIMKYEDEKFRHVTKCVGVNVLSLD